jgi:hypothetical protein
LGLQRPVRLFLAVQIGPGAAGNSFDNPAWSEQTVRIFEQWQIALRSGGVIDGGGVFEPPRPSAGYRHRPWPLLEEGWPRFSGPQLYYPSRRHMTAPLRAFIEYIK